MFGSVGLFEADRVAQSGHRFLEILLLDGARGHQRGARLGDDVELSCAASALRRPRSSAVRPAACAADSHDGSLRILPTRILVVLGRSNEAGQLVVIWG
jgi:hypothetical protein